MNTPLSCEQFLSWISEYLDGELDPTLAEAVRLHSLHCARCVVVLDTTRQMLRIVGDERNFAMPPAASERLRQAIEQGLGEPLIPTALRPPSALPRPAPARPRFSFLYRALAAAALLALVVFGVGRWRAAATTTSGWLMDRHCYLAFQSHPADHTRACLLKCDGNVYGLVDAGGHFLPFDAKGNQSVLAALRASTQSDHFWVTVHAKESRHQVLEVEDLELTDPASGTSLNSTAPAQTASLDR